jgi:hypothetical protein
MQQNMVYGMVVRVYYKNAVLPYTVEISSHKSGDIIEEETTLKVPMNNRISKVEFIGLMDNISYEGDGKYYQWHYNYHRGELVNHI